VDLPGQVSQLLSAARLRRRRAQVQG